jgi:hypothetical protein
MKKLRLVKQLLIINPPSSDRQTHPIDVKEHTTMMLPLTPTCSSPQPTKLDAANALKTLRGFIGDSQLRVIRDGCRSEEKQYFFDKLVEMAGIVTRMPKTYDTNGRGDNAVAYLHYFSSSCDWFITEKDEDSDGEGQIQAYGLADLGYGGELGYISIAELITLNVVLDLHFTPCTLAQIKARQE